jgi:hypothetical protein
MHAALDDRVLDAKQFGDAGLHEHGLLGCNGRIEESVVILDDRGDRLRRSD